MNLDRLLSSCDLTNVTLQRCEDLKLRTLRDMKEYGTRRFMKQTRGVGTATMRHLNRLIAACDSESPTPTTMNDGGPAFPVPGNPATQPGMSLRDWFAGQAMAAIVSTILESTSSSPDGVPQEVMKHQCWSEEMGLGWNNKEQAYLGANNTAESAYIIADAMLKERAISREA